ncbi:MAG: YhbY family RNA-binding protein [Candidatus Thioglobus sp.]|nr:YhbY family RNA-binding protein [Candidatus Thioglobus sp.]
MTKLTGRQGLSAAVLAELELSLTKHELLKIKISADNSEQKQQIIEKIIEFSQAHLVQVIGNVLVIYRAFDEPKIILGRR